MTPPTGCGGSARSKYCVEPSSPACVTVITVTPFERANPTTSSGELPGACQIVEPESVFRRIAVGRRRGGGDVSLGQVEVETGLGLPELRVSRARCRAARGHFRPARGIACSARTAPAGFGAYFQYPAPSRGSSETNGGNREHDREATVRARRRPGCDDHGHGESREHHESTWQQAVQDQHVRGEGPGQRDDPPAVDVEGRPQGRDHRQQSGEKQEPARRGTPAASQEQGDDREYRQTEVPAGLGGAGVVVARDPGRPPAHERGSGGHDQIE